jgi:hypothetical protein
MKRSLPLLLGLLSIAPGLYAMDKDAEFKREQEAKAARSIEESDEVDTDYYMVPDLRPANMRYQQWLEADQNPENIAKKLARAAATKQTDEILVRDRDVPLARTSLPTDIQERIWSFADEENRKKRFVGNHMEQLIPAVIEWIGNGSLFDHLVHAKTNRVTLDGINQHRAKLSAEIRDAFPAITKLPDDNKLYYLGRSFWRGERIIHYHGHFNPVNDHVEVGGDVMLRPVLSTQRPLIKQLSHNQYNALYYVKNSNGVTIFKVHDAERAKLERLSEAQLNYIVSLYHIRARNLEQHTTEEIHLTKEQISIHKSLPSSMRENLENVYILVEMRKESAADYLRIRCRIGLAFAVAGTAFGIALLYR